MRAQQRKDAVCRLFNQGFNGMHFKASKIEQSGNDLHFTIEFAKQNASNSILAKYNETVKHQRSIIYSYDLPSKSKIKRLTKRLLKRYHLGKYQKYVAELSFNQEHTQIYDVNADDYFEFYCGAVEPLELGGTWSTGDLPDSVSIQWLLEDFSQDASLTTLIGKVNLMLNNQPTLAKTLQSVRILDAYYPNHVVAEV